MSIQRLAKIEKELNPIQEKYRDLAVEDLGLTGSFSRCVLFCLIIAQSLFVKEFPFDINITTATTAMSEEKKKKRF